MVPSEAEPTSSPPQPKRLYQAWKGNNVSSPRFFTCVREQSVPRQIILRFSAGIPVRRTAYTRAGRSLPAAVIVPRRRPSHRLLLPDAVQVLPLQRATTHAPGCATDCYHHNTSGPVLPVHDIGQGPRNSATEHKSPAA